MTSEAKKYQPVETSQWAHCHCRHCRAAAAAAAAFRPASAAAAPQAWVCQLCVCARDRLWWHALCFDTSLPVYWWNSVFFPRLYFELPVMERRFDLIPGTILTPAGTDEQRYLWQRRIDIYSANRDLTVSGIVFRGELSMAPA